MFDLQALLALIMFGLGIRTLCWHLQSWQLREYRWDRMKAWLNTREGHSSLYNLWFFKGLLPRPKVSFRILLILILSLGFIFIIGITVGLTLYTNGYFRIDQPPLKPIPSPLMWPAIFIITERLIFLGVMGAVALSKIPVLIAQRTIFNRAKQTIAQSSSNITIIGITGSYGKSSTKEILVHLLKDNLGTDAVLYNPANENNEIAIARLIIKNKNFFTRHSTLDTQHFFVCEMGAYSGGEIGMMCDFIQPHIGILTGLNQQHIELFGSFETIKNTKFELAQAAKDKVFFNADNAYLQTIFNDRQIDAQPIALSSRKILKDLTSTAKETTFKLYDQSFTLPWPGAFFAENALLALECAREIGVSATELKKSLKTLPPLKRALNLETHSHGYTIMHDTYSANPDGVISAIDHLENFTGQRIMIGLPLKELGQQSHSIHEQIFHKLKQLKVETYWLQDDFQDLGAQILGDQFHRLNPRKTSDINTLKKRLKKLKTSDVILLESKLPKSITDLF